MSAFDGNWETVSGRLGTDTIPLPKSLFVIAGERYSVKTPDGLDEGRIEWGAEGELREMDMIGTGGSHAGIKIQALARVRGKVMQLCYAVDGSKRPRDFNASPGTAVVTVRYRRLAAD